jgi:gliding motility-associated-like protein
MLSLGVFSYGQTFTPATALPFLVDTGYCRSISWIDYDNDYDLDVYITGTESYDAATGTFTSLHLLYENNGDETFTLSPELTSTPPSFGHGWGDHDNDGNIDVYIAKTWGWGDVSEFHTNNGDGTFNLELGSGIVFASTPYEGTVSWGDFNNDGFLDVYLVRWNNLSNHLFLNNGDGTFSAAGAAGGEAVTANGWSSTGTWGDFDNDNDLDLFVSNYTSGAATGENILYENTGGAFTTVTGAGSIITETENTRDVNWVDFDNDRDLDIFLVNQGSPDRLYQNNGDGTFTDVSAIAPLGSGTSWTSNWGDFDNDGDKDVIIIGFSGTGDSRFLRNDGGSFTQIDPSGIMPTATSGSLSTSACFTDYNNDGWLDVHFTYPGDGSDDYFYENEGLACRSWIEIELTGTASNRDGIGARIMAKANIDGTDTWQMHQVTAQNSKVAHNMQRTHFGFYEATTIDSLVIYWPSGAVCTFTDVDVNQIVDISEDCVITPLLPPPSGDHNFVDFCKNEDDTLLFGLITSGTFDAECGDCIDETTGLFSPSSVEAGTYTIINQKVCDADDTITVEIFPAAYAGADTAVSICTSEPTYNLADANPSADAGGSWFDPSGGTFSGSFTTGTDPEGDYIYVVDGTAMCPGDTATINISLATVGSGSIFVSNNEGCTPVSVDFVNASAASGESCSWDFGDGSTATGCTPSHTYTAEGCFDVTLTVTSPEGCEDVQTIPDLVCTYDPPEAGFSIPNSFLTADNTTVEFTNTSTNAISYEWIFGQLGTSAEVDPEFTFPQGEQGEYQVCLTAYNALGCSDNICAPINVQEALIYYVPNAFTPDGNEYNQSFLPVFTSGFDPYDYHMTVFNRWGEILFESYNATYGWDGTFGGDIVEEGIYLWKIEFKDAYTDKRYSQIGHILLMR